MKQSTKLAVFSFASLAVGFVIGLAVGSMPTDSGSIAGDISKVKKFKKDVATQQNIASLEKLLSDSTELRKTAVSVAVLSSRMQDCSALIELSIKATDGKDEFAEINQKLKSIQPLAQNASKAGSVAVESFNALTSNDKTGDISYDQASRNMMLSYFMVSNQRSIAKEFVQAADNYIQKKGLKSAEDIAGARDLWKSYAMVDPSLNSDKEETAWWKSKEDQFSGEQLSSFIEKTAIFNGEPATVVVGPTESFKFPMGSLGYNVNAMGTIVENTTIQKVFNVIGFKDAEKSFVENGTATDVTRATIENAAGQCIRSLGEDLGYNSQQKTPLDL